MISRLARIALCHVLTGRNAKRSKCGLHLDLNVLNNFLANFSENLDTDFTTKKTQDPTTHAEHIFILNIRAGNQGSHIEIEKQPGF